MFPLIERPALALMSNGTYKYINNMNESTATLFGFVGCTLEDFETIAGEVNEREKALGKGVSQYHRTPEDIRNAHKQLKASARENVHSDERDEQPSEDDHLIRPARRPGRPPGSKNKKTLAREVAGLLRIPKRKRGRPVGSKDRTSRKRRTKKVLQEAKSRMERITQFQALLRRVSAMLT